MTLNLKPLAAKKPRAPRPTQLPTPSEHEIQADIVRMLRVHGYIVMETTAYRQKGSSGVTKGIPDLLVRYASNRSGDLIGIEVKRHGPSIKWSAPEQEEAFLRGVFVVAQSPDAALWAASKGLVGKRDGFHDTSNMHPGEIKARLDTLAVQIEIARANRRAERRRR